MVLMRRCSHGGSVSFAFCSNKIGFGKIGFSYLMKSVHYSVTASCLLALGMFVTISGCSDVKLEKAVPVAGVLKYQGKPLEGYRITFQPVDKERQGATAETDSSGAFKMGTNKPGDGAAVGKHKVGVSFIAQIAEGEPGKEVFKTLTPKFKVPAKFEDPNTSGVEVDIPAAGNTSLEIELK